MTYVEKLLPKVLSKRGCEDFDHNLIRESLLRETSLTGEQAEMITLESARLAIQISQQIKKLTSPIIREIVEIVLLQHGLEYNRLEYTRVGISRHDMQEIIMNKNYPDREVAHLVLKEFNEVLRLMEKIKK